MTAPAFPEFYHIPPRQNATFTSPPIRHNPCSQNDVQLAIADLHRSICRTAIRRFVSAARRALPRNVICETYAAIYRSLRRLIAQLARLARGRRLSRNYQHATVQSPVLCASGLHT